MLSRSFASTPYREGKNHALKQARATYLRLPYQCRSYPESTYLFTDGTGHLATVANSHCRKKIVTTHLSARCSHQRLKRSEPSLKVDLLFRFLRPYALLSTTLQAMSASLLAIQSTTDLTGRFLIGMLEALVPAILTNIFIVGLNEITDINIDKINKPYLPLASGEMSLTTAIGIVALAAIASLTCGIIVGSIPLLWLVASGIFLGVGYSIKVPLLYWKGRSLTTILTLICAWAFGRQLGFFLHMQTSVLKRALVLTRPFFLSMAIVSLFAIVIAMSKDICDIEGDKAYGLKTYSIMLGGEKTFWICIYLIQTIYIVGMLGGLTATTLWRQVASVVCHVFMSIILWWHAKRFDIGNKQEMHNFYMFVFKLYYLEYMLVPLFH